MNKSPSNFEIISSAVFDNRNEVVIVKRSTWHDFINVYIFKALHVRLFNIQKQKLRKFVSY